MVRVTQDEILEDLSLDPNVAKLVDENQLYKHIHKDYKLLNILHLNIRNIKKKLDELVILLENYKFHSTDIIILSESFQIPNIDYYNIPGYNTYYNRANFNKNVR